MDSELWPRLVYLSLLLAALGGWMMVEYRGRMGVAMRSFAAWGLIFVGLAAGYGLWQDINSGSRPRQMASDAGEMVLRRAADGHFYAAIDINQTEVFFMVDTGATNMVLTQKDAERLGFHPDELRYFGEASTANGIVRTARVGLDQVSFGPFDDYGVDAWVNEGEMDGSLLGMDYLRRFSIRIEGDRMILTR
ncbi:TIGR02281 family clan AA aspartic protease [Xinfangfangia sp. D13-10-4-6]|uniref:retropepsin-like aspartic protease family protein n=1 Tax=Pseudogemmobacter hezensis TaxID=2737662 RepID=UPI001556720C|nr:TIGR02281 family clan AA aspartic protease [Pseudogemmobacter hezensis]NPD15848.1 TIGR02281 family clan AA aspartic protease [Pseudogemmobacter hezensis]